MLPVSDNKHGNPPCHKCNSTRVIKSGTRVYSGASYQNYLCKDCKSQWQPDKPEFTGVFAKSNEARRRYNTKTYKDVFVRMRYDTHNDLIERLDKYAQANPDKGALQKKILEVLGEYFPKV